MRRLFNILQLMMLMAVPAALLAMPHGETRTRAKARYYYMEGALQQAKGQDVLAHEYFKKAAAIDPTYLEANHAFGNSRLLVRTDTMQTRTELLNSLAMMKPFIDAFPDDFNENQFYAYAAGQLDSPQEAIRVFERIVERQPDKTTVLLQLGDAYMATHNTQKAVEALNKFEAAEGMSPQLSMRKITYLIAGADTTAALKEADALITSNPKDPNYRILKGDLLQALGKTDSVEKYYKQAEEINPEYGAAKLALATLYLNRGDSAAYDAKIYEALLSEDFGMEDKTALLAQYLQTLINQKSDTKRGDTLFSVLRDQYPHEPSIINLEARYNAAKGDTSTASELMGYVVGVEPDKEQNWGQLISYQISSQDYHGAMDSYKKATQHIPPTTTLMLLHATAAALAEDYDEAQRAYADMIHEIDPNLPVLQSADSIPTRQFTSDQLTRLSNIYTMLGDMWYGAKRLDNTFKAYDNALHFLPDNELTLNNYAYFLAVNGGDLQKARQMSRTALDYQPDNETYIDTYAWILYLLGDYKEARNYQQSAVEKAEAANEPSAELYSHYGDILFKDGEPELAVAYWEKALKLDPDNQELKQKVKTKTLIEPSK